MRPIQAISQGVAVDTSDMGSFLSTLPEAGDHEKRHPAEQEHHRRAQHTAHAGKQVDISQYGPKQEEEHAKGERAAAIFVQAYAQ